NGLHVFSDRLMISLVDVPVKSEATSDGQNNLGGLIAALAKDARTSPHEISRVMTWLDTNAKDAWKKTDLSVLQPWVPRVSRYSYKLFRGSRSEIHGL